MATRKRIERMKHRARCQRVRELYAMLDGHPDRKKRWSPGRQALARRLQRP